MSRKRREQPIIENVTITGVAAEGKSLVRINDLVVFVPFCVPGDVVDVQIVKKKHKYNEGRIINMIKNKEQREVLMLRYIEGKSWADILEKRGCDDLRSQYKLHQRALDSIQELINDHSMTTM